MMPSRSLVAQGHHVPWTRAPTLRFCKWAVGFSSWPNDRLMTSASVVHPCATALVQHARTPTLTLGRVLPSRSFAPCLHLRDTLSTTMACLATGPLSTIATTCSTTTPQPQSFSWHVARRRQSGQHQPLPRMNTPGHLRARLRPDWRLRARWSWVAELLVSGSPAPTSQRRRRMSRAEPRQA